MAKWILNRNRRAGEVSLAADWRKILPGETAELLASSYIAQDDLYQLMLGFAERYMERHNDPDNPYHYANYYHKFPQYFPWKIPHPTKEQVTEQLAHMLVETVIKDRNLQPLTSSSHRDLYDFSWGQFYGSAGNITHSNRLPEELRSILAEPVALRDAILNLDIHGAKPSPEAWATTTRILQRQGKQISERLRERMPNQTNVADASDAKRITDVEKKITLTIRRFDEMGKMVTDSKRIQLIKNLRAGLEKLRGIYLSHPERTERERVAQTIDDVIHRMMVEIAAPTEAKDPFKTITDGALRALRKRTILPLEDKIDKALQELGNIERLVEDPARSDLAASFKAGLRKLKGVDLTSAQRERMAHAMDRMIDRMMAEIAVPTITSENPFLTIFDEAANVEFVKPRAILENGLFAEPEDAVISAEPFRAENPDLSLNRSELFRMASDLTLKVGHLGNERHFRRYHQELGSDPETQLHASQAAFAASRILEGQRVYRMLHTKHASPQDELAAVYTVSIGLKPLLKTMKPHTMDTVVVNDPSGRIQREDVKYIGVVPSENWSTPAAIEFMSRYDKAGEQARLAAPITKFKHNEPLSEKVIAFINRGRSFEGVQREYIANMGVNARDLVNPASRRMEEETDARWSANSPQDLPGTPPIDRTAPFTPPPAKEKPNCDKKAALTAPLTPPEPVKRRGKPEPVKQERQRYKRPKILKGLLARIAPERPAPETRVITYGEPKVLHNALTGETEEIRGVQEPDLVDRSNWVAREARRHLDAIGKGGVA